jgi:hypothetical protein
MPPEFSSDHDILVTIATKVDTFLTTITDHERRLRRVELAVIGVGVSAVAVFLKVTGLG